MRRMQRSVAAIFALCSVFAGCDDLAFVVTPGAPSAFTNELTFVRVHPHVVVAPSAPSSCIGSPPPSVSFTLSVQAGASAVRVRQVKYHGADVNGGVMPTVAVGSDALTVRF